MTSNYLEFGLIHISWRPSRFYTCTICWRNPMHMGQAFRLRETHFGQLHMRIYSLETNVLNQKRLGAKTTSNNPLFKHTKDTIWLTVCVNMCQSWSGPIMSHRKIHDETHTLANRSWRGPHLAASLDAYGRWPDGARRACWHRRGTRAPCCCRDIRLKYCTCHTHSLSLCLSLSLSASLPLCTCHTKRWILWRFLGLEWTCHGFMASIIYTSSQTCFCKVIL